MGDLDALAGDILAGLRANFYAQSGAIQALEYRVAEGILSPAEATDKALRIFEAAPGEVEDVIDQELKRRS